MIYIRRDIFRGVATALITPFSDGEIDYAALGRIIDMQIEGGVAALVLGGTTGEAATLDEAERDTLYRFTADYVGGRVKLILGIGTNDTKRTIKYALRYNKISHDGYLVVTPYYNRGTRDGVLMHYRAVADAAEKPVILYNVPTRTGVNLEVSDVQTLSEHSNIVAIKEAYDSAKKLTELAALRDKIALYAGCDSQIYANLALFGAGVISVISNLYPSRVVALYESFTRGDFEGAFSIQTSLLPLIREAFSETNPAPIKAMMSRAGLCKNEVRLPLAPI